MYYTWIVHDIREFKCNLQNNIIFIHVQLKCCNIQDTTYTVHVAQCPSHVHYWQKSPQEIYGKNCTLLRTLHRDQDHPIQQVVRSNSSLATVSSSQSEPTAKNLGLYSDKKSRMIEHNSTAVVWQTIATSFVLVIEDKKWLQRWGRTPVCIRPEFHTKSKI